MKTLTWAWAPKFDVNLTYKNLYRPFKSNIKKRLNIIVELANAKNSNMRMDTKI